MTAITHRPSSGPHPLSPVALARLIDISAVQACHAESDIRRLAEIARQYNFINAHVLPNWVPLMRELLAGSATLVGSPVGFPSGGTITRVKVKEAEALLDDGVEEMDVVANIGRLRSGQFSYVLEDLKAVVDVASGHIPVKVILETAYLDDDQLHAGCDAAVESGADYVKTGTGWSGKPTTVETVCKILSFVGDAVAIKASGGIRTLETVTEMLELGVSRFGINSDAAVRLLTAAADVATKGESREE